MANPIIAEVTRGAVVESRHRGAYAIVSQNSEVVSSAGNVYAVFFPR